MGRLVAIHQPNVLPWLGYFDKLARADVFVLLDSVQFPKTGGTWTNRVRMLIGNQADWITIPVVRSYRGFRLIREMRIDERTPWRARILKSLQSSYGRTPFFHEVFPVVSEVLLNATDSLADYNAAAIRRLAGTMGLDGSRLVSSSDLGADPSLHATELLVALTRAAGGTAYLCGGGATGYQDDQRFADAGLDVVYQRFQHPEYPQANSREFIPGLSVVDLLMNRGLSAAGALWRGADRPGAYASP